MLPIILIVLVVILFAGGFHPRGQDSRNILWVIAAIILIYLLFAHLPV